LSCYRILWNPWRFEYIKSTLKPRDGCVFCRLLSRSDEESYILYRGKYSYIVLNAYPYNSGHLMIVPYKHTANLEDLEKETIDEMIDLLNKSIKVLRESLKPDGFNIGMNLGRAAGAGVEDHVHIHVVPRWVGDTNFMAIIGYAKTLPVSLDETYRLLRDCWRKLFSSEEALDH